MDAQTTVFQFLQPLHEKRALWVKLWILSAPVYNSQLWERMSINNLVIFLALPFSFEVVLRIALSVFTKIWISDGYTVEKSNKRWRKTHSDIVTRVINDPLLCCCGIHLLFSQRLTILQRLCALVAIALIKAGTDQIIFCSNSIFNSLHSIILFCYLLTLINTTELFLYNRTLKRNLKKILVSG